MVYNKKTLNLDFLAAPPVILNSNTGPSSSGGSGFPSSGNEGPFMGMVATRFDFKILKNRVQPNIIYNYNYQ